ncbi:MAG TPA: tetratricopeptide repeat protein [Bryobacteraceae bacterium]|jgi:tetratricopeptide (TPR) repeat protein
MRGYVLLAVAACATASAAAADSCAVLHFSNDATRASAKHGAATASNADWIGVSIAETLRDALELRGFVTLSREDLEEAYRRLGLSLRSPLTQASVMKIGEALDAEQVIYGNFEVQPAPAGAAGDSRGSLKISARILDRRHLRQSGEFAETGAIEDLSTMEAHLAWQAMQFLAPSLAPPESDFKSLRSPIRLDAEENYIRGLMAAAPEQREKFFLQAARLDARFAHPEYELGQIHYQRKEYRQAAEWLQKIGPDEVESHEAAFLLGLALFQASDYAGAQKALQPIAAAIPLSEVYNNLGAAESRRNLPQAVDDFRKAVDGDSGDPVYLFNLGYALWKKGDFTGAAERFRAELERDPDDSMATLLLGRCLKKQGFRAGDSGDARLQGLERLKTTYQERAYRQLKSLLDAPRVAPAPPPAPAPK